MLCSNCWCDGCQGSRCTALQQNGSTSGCRRAANAYKLLGAGFGHSCSACTHHQAVTIIALMACCNQQTTVCILQLCRPEYTLHQQAVLQAPSGAHHNRTHQLLTKMLYALMAAGNLPSKLEQGSTHTAIGTHMHECQCVQCRS